MAVDDFFERLANENPAITDAAAEVDPPFILAGNVYRARTRLGLTQIQLAERVGVRQPRIAEIERGDANPRLDTIARVAHALGVSVSALLDDSVPEESGYEQSSSPASRRDGEPPVAGNRTGGDVRPHAAPGSQRDERTRSGAPPAQRAKGSPRRSAA